MDPNHRLRTDLGRLVCFPYGEDLLERGKRNAFLYH